MTENEKRIEELNKNHDIPDADLTELLRTITSDEEEMLYADARKTR